MKNKFIIEENIGYNRIWKKFLKKHPDLLNKYFFLLENLEKDPKDPSIKPHKLNSRQLDNVWACSINFKYRLIFLLQEEERVIILYDIGSHDDVY